MEKAAMVAAFILLGAILDKFRTERMNWLICG